MVTRSLGWGRGWADEAQGISRQWNYSVRYVPVAAWHYAFGKTHKTVRHKDRGLIKTMDQLNPFPCLPESMCSRENVIIIYLAITI